MRAPEADEAGKPLRAAAAGNEAELDLGLTDLRVLGGDADVAAHRELEAAAEAEPVDRRDERLVRRVHPRAELLDPAGRATLLSLRGRLAERRELRDVGAGDERPLASAHEHDRTNARVVVEPVDLRLELLEERRGECVDGRVVDRDDGDVAVLLRRDELRH